MGSEGQVARSLREAAAKRLDVVLECGRRPAVDLLRPETIYTALSEFRPDIVINPAAYTAVDRAESELDLAFELNEGGAGAVAAAAAESGVPVIHLSTDYVFDGKKEAPYIEADPVNPQSVYGRSKLGGERLVASKNPRHIILRTAWVYAPFGNNFVRTVLRLAGERGRLSVVDDQIGCPTHAPDIADAILAVANLVHKSGWRDEFAGVTHLAGPDAVTWCGFAREIVRASAERGGQAVPVDSISTSDYPTLAARPANSRLLTARLLTTFGVRLPPLEHSLGSCLDRLMASRQQERGIS